jgi:ASC-1-like (ASCH) protein
MTAWNVTLNSPWFEYVKIGEKIYEGRCNWKESAKYQIGDTLIVNHHTDLNEKEFSVKIIDIIKFDTFETALNTLELHKVLPGVVSVQDGVSIYFKYYKLTTQIDNGILMIQVNK